MKNQIDEQKVRELGLRKIAAFVPSEVLASASGPAATEVCTSEECLVKSRSAAERQELHRKKIEELGLTQLNVIIPNSGDVRKGMICLAKKTVETRDWEKALCSDPSILTLLNKLESARVKGLRVEDLEDRHRKTKPFIDFHADLMAERGLRRIVLYLLGIVDSPVARSPSSPKNDAAKR